MNEINLNGNITEQTLLEMSNHFKEVLEGKEGEIKTIKHHTQIYRATLYSIIGMVDILNEISIPFLNADEETDESITFRKTLEILTMKLDKFIYNHH